MGGELRKCARGLREEVSAQPETREDDHVRTYFQITLGARVVVPILHLCEAPSTEGKTRQKRLGRPRARNALHSKLVAYADLQHNVNKQKMRVSSRLPQYEVLMTPRLTL